LLFLDHTLMRAKFSDQEAVNLGAWLREIASKSNISVKILATSSVRLGWMGEIAIRLDDLDIESGVELFICNLDAQQRQSMEKDIKAVQFVQNLVRLLNEHLESIDHAAGLPQHRYASLEKLIREHLGNMSSFGRTTEERVIPLDGFTNLD